ncbi:amidohydrolase [Brevibacillus humidisoli]|uniref:amidohydrolase n=1 Tax=Brevibacillus humidisoli TaxID=2895522 RepID=UPI001E65C30C|nr:amidohydrolase [Brevibacillus humidisoli]UFJ42605.1 amidohydrolase [Brevibacillus humidisoli]
MTTDIQHHVNQLYPTLVQWRRDFHKHAETGWLEFRTASLVAQRLASWGYLVQAGREVIDEHARMGVPTQEVLTREEQRALEQGADPNWLPYFSGGLTGVVGILDTGRPGPTIGFRFDMDALDLHESADESHLPAALGFRSINENMMHACGHDAHTTIGLGVAHTLAQIKDRLSGRIKLIFQPAEEGVRGAKAMVAVGVVDDLQLFFASHVGVNHPLGEVVCGANGYLATTKLNVSYTGAAAHAGGSPEEGKNALLAAATAALNLHGIARHSAGSSRINVGVLQAGSGRNIVPASAQLKLETRGETSEINQYVLDRALRIIRGAAAMYDVTETIEIVGEAQTCNSSPALFPFVRAQAAQVEGIHSIVELAQAGGSEDATTMMARVQQNGGLASYVYFGTTLAAGHHKETFDIDEKVLGIAVKTLSLCALHAAQLERQDGQAATD